MGLIVMYQWACLAAPHLHRDLFVFEIRVEYKWQISVVRTSSPSAPCSPAPSWLVYKNKLLDKMKRTYLTAACFTLIHSHLLLHTCKIKQKWISDLMMLFGLQWGVVPILSSSCESNLPVTLWTLLSSLFLPFPPFVFHFLNFTCLPLPSPIFTLSPLSMETHSYLFNTLYSSSLHPHQDHDKTQEEVLKHQASISQLKRSFMEAPPPSPPQLNQWEKRLTSSPATIRIQQQQVVCLPGCVCQQLIKRRMTLQDICQEYVWAFAQKQFLFLFFYGYATKNVSITPAVLLCFMYV